MSKLTEFYQKRIKPDLALYLVLLAELCNSLMLIATKLLESKDEFTEPLNSIQILLVRMVITFIGTTTYLLLFKVQDAPWGPKQYRKWMSLRGFLGFFGVLGLYYPLQYMSVSDCIVITFLSPSVTSIIAFFVLKERFTKLEAVSAIVSFIGVLLIAKPSFIFGQSVEFDDKVESSNLQERFIAILVGLVGVLCSSSVYVLIRFIGESVHAVQTVSYFALISAILSFSTIALSPSMTFIIPNTWFQWVLMISVGINGFLMQFLFTTGLQKEKASRTALMQYSQIVYGLIWEYLIWKHIPNVWSFLGLIIVLGSAFSVIYFKPSENEVVLDEESVEEVSIRLKDFKETRV